MSDNFKSAAARRLQQAYDNTSRQSRQTPKQRRAVARPVERAQKIAPKDRATANPPKADTSRADMLAQLRKRVANRRTPRQGSAKVSIPTPQPSQKWTK